MPGVCLSIYHILVVVCLCERKRTLKKNVLYELVCNVPWWSVSCVSGVWPLDWLPLWAASVAGPTLPPCGFPSPMAPLPSWPFDG